MKATKRMTMPDRVFLSFDTEYVFTHIGLLAIFAVPDTSPRGFVGDLVARLRAASRFVEPFNFRIAPGVRRRWQVLGGNDIDLDHHLVHWALPAPGTMRQLDAAVARVHSRPLDPTKPLWQLHVIEGIEADRFAVYLKVHHALMDGMAVMTLFSMMVSPDPDDRVLRPIWSVELPRPKSATTRRPAIRRIAADLTAQARLFVREGRHPTDPAFAVPMTGPRCKLLNGRLSRQRSFASQAFDAEAMRRLAERADASLNDLFLVVLSGALRRYVAERAGLAERGLVAGVPVASRSGVSDPRHNAGGMILVNLFTDLPDPIDRLRGIKRSSALAKEHLESVSPGAADLYAVLTFGPFMLQEVTRLSGRVRSPFNVTVSNVPGPRQQQHLLGARLDGLYGVANLGHGQRLNMTVVSASGRIGVGFTGCGDALGDVHVLADYLPDAVAELEAALRVGG